MLLESYDDKDYIQAGTFAIKLINRLIGGKDGKHGKHGTYENGENVKERYLQPDELGIDIDSLMIS